MRFPQEGPSSNICTSKLDMVTRVKMKERCAAGWMDGWMIEIDGCRPVSDLFRTCFGSVLDLIFDLIQISWLMGTASDQNVLE